MSQPNIYFYKTGDVKDPTRAHASDAGIDLYTPNNETTIIKAGEHGFINLKIKSTFPEGHVLMLCDKSGVALKKHLKVCGGIVDSGYQGEIKLQLANLSKEDVIIEPGEKIVQGLLLPVRLAPVKMCKDEKEYMHFAGESERGVGGYGSTGVK